MGEKEEYLRKKEEYRRVCKEKKRKQQEREEEKVAQIREERMVNCQAWAYINRERKKRTVCTTDIKIEEWRKYFKDLLEGEDKYTRVREKKDEMEPEENQISETEVKKHIKRLKKSKAAGEDNIENEA